MDGIFGSERKLLAALGAAAVTAAALWFPSPAAASEPEVVLPPVSYTTSDCTDAVPIVSASDTAAQSDLYSAITLAGVVATDCIVLAGPRDDPMPAEQIARLETAATGGFVVGGVAAVPETKISRYAMTRLAGADRWETANAVGTCARRIAVGYSCGQTQAESEEPIRFPPQLWDVENRCRAWSTDDNSPTTLILDGWGYCLYTVEWDAVTDEDATYSVHVSLVGNEKCMSSRPPAHPSPPQCELSYQYWAPEGFFVQVKSLTDRVCAFGDPYGCPETDRNPRQCYYQPPQTRPGDGPPKIASGTWQLAEFEGSQCPSPLEIYVSAAWSNSALPRGNAKWTIAFTPQ
ncbi:hypothetical protein [Candidatus Poriferisodalis sp.]|uniref:hypothetical protein n=1 Tax=Candidatus Poriferisodalis sp. TaxID=3101277 RepID=UPI003C6ECD96